MKNKVIRIGTAGWGVPTNCRSHFPSGDSLLERYSLLFNAVEINTSFYKSHRKTTYKRWAAATPADFQFAVKMYKQITHDQNFINVEADLKKFIDEISGLQTKLGVLLIQLPPSFSFDPKIASAFFKLLRNMFNGKVVLEPRHVSWSHLEALNLLHEANVEFVIADPVKMPIELPTQQLFSYYRLHGSPKIYSSSYDTLFLNQLANHLNDSSWVIFDNTQLGAATQNALDLRQLKTNN